MLRRQHAGICTWLEAQRLAVLPGEAQLAIGGRCCRLAVSLSLGSLGCCSSYLLQPLTPLGSLCSGALDVYTAPCCITMCDRCLPVEGHWQAACQA